MSATTKIQDFINASNFAPLLLAPLTALLTGYTETTRSFADFHPDPNTAPILVVMTGAGGTINYTISYSGFQPTVTPPPGATKPASAISVGAGVPVLASVIGGDSSAQTQSLIRYLSRGYFVDGPAAHPGVYPTMEQLFRAVAPQFIPASQL
jgi:hypothetical protein